MTLHLNHCFYRSSRISSTKGTLSLTPICPPVLCHPLSSSAMLVFLRNHDDLTHLRAHLNLYCSASNAKINFQKVNAFSLTGANLGFYWLSGLADLQITNVWNSTDPDPLIYLGLPFIQSSSQRFSFKFTFLRSLRRLAELHSRRNLSVLSRATVSNTLLLSQV